MVPTTARFKTHALSKQQTEARTQLGANSVYFSVRRNKQKDTK